jgi:hypothetical protein
MNVEIIQNGRVLRVHHHNGQQYAEAPESGEYEIRLTNTSPAKRMAVVSVDGVNVIDGKTAGMDGSGYVLNPWQSTTIKGFLRGSTECARFTFAASEGSYAAQTGRGTKNTGVIGVAVFDEKPRPVVFTPPVVITEVHHHHHHPTYRGSGMWYGTGTTSGQVFGSCSDVSDDNLTISSCSEDPQPKPLSYRTRGTKSAAVRSAAPDLGTAYGRAEAFYTTTTTFERATTVPALVVTLRYGVADKLREWGVPVDAVTVSPPAPCAFPASAGYAQPPVGWRG